MSSKPQTEIYEIRIQGYLDAHRREQFESMGIAQGPEGVTCLTGPLVDQAALYGLLSRIRDLGMPLISVTLLNDSDKGCTGRSA